MTLVLRMLRRVSAYLEVPAEDREAERADRLQEETDLDDLMQQLEREHPRPES